MMRRPDRSGIKAANDNVMLMLTSPRRYPIARSEPFRIGPRTLLIAGFAGLILVALSGAFLIALAVVGLLAAAIAGGRLVRRHLRRGAKPPLGALDAVGWAKARN